MPLRDTIIPVQAVDPGPSRILEQLPSGLEWVVLFRLSAIRSIIDAATIRRMYFLPDDVSLDDCAYVVLTSAGRYFSSARAAGALTAYDHTPIDGLAPSQRSMAATHGAELALLDLAHADCIGIGQRPGDRPAYLQVMLDGDVGQALALFHRSPSRHHYDLLSAVGVEFVSEERRGEHRAIRFRNRLRTHVKAGALGGFARTAHCDEFFMNHGEIDERLLSGLVQASEDRTRWGRMACSTVAVKLADLGVSRSLAMVCQPPPPQAPYAYGDLVPLGLLLWALDSVPAEDVDALTAFGRRLVVDALRQHLLDRRQYGLWSFHTGRLVTATDSALILLGIADVDGADDIDALESFSAGAAGYLPQRWSSESEPDRMREDPCNQHWRQPDFATTCLIRGLRARAGLTVRTPLDTVATGFDERSGLFFANPYLTDLCVALAIARDPQAAPLRQRLTQEVIGSVNPDGSFGRYDCALSTALAVVTLGTLGYDGRLIRLAQLRLTEQFEWPSWPVSTPFYSTFLVSGDEAATTRAPQHLLIEGRTHELSLYRDEHRIILSALGALALAVPCDVSRPDSNLTERRPPHPRYGCETVEEYLAGFALPPYAAGARERSPS